MAVCEGTRLCVWWIRVPLYRFNRYYLRFADFAVFGYKWWPRSRTNSVSTGFHNGVLNWGVFCDVVSVFMVFWVGKSKTRGIKTQTIKEGFQYTRPLTWYCSLFKNEVHSIVVLISGQAFSHLAPFKMFFLLFEGTFSDLWKSIFFLVYFTCRLWMS